MPRPAFSTPPRWTWLAGMALAAALACDGGRPEPYDPAALHGQLPDVVSALAGGDPERALLLLEQQT